MEVKVYLTTLKEKLVLLIGVINVSTGTSVEKMVSAIAVHPHLMRGRAKCNCRAGQSETLWYHYILSPVIKSCPLGLQELEHDSGEISMVLGIVHF